MKPSELTSIITAFQTGQKQTTRDVLCPVCGGTAHVEAVLMKAGRQAGLLSVSVGCGNCGRAIVADGLERWPGWEAIALRPEEQLDPKASIRELKAHYRKMRG